MRIPRHHQDFDMFRIGDPKLNLHLPRLHPGRGADNPNYFHLNHTRYTRLSETLLVLFVCLSFPEPGSFHYFHLLLCCLDAVFFFDDGGPLCCDAHFLKKKQSC